ncbi:AAA family ATPase [Corynebacterium sp. A21]|uniref:AAA family ATPase n=1 Tax=Corynebacterium sp. A21 TaxID=3457318 RepID=UPI003FD22E0B
MYDYHLYASPRPGFQTPDWVFKVPAFKALKSHGSLPFNQPITLITGENGVGKSTLLEGIAVSCNFNDYGGPFGAEMKSRKNPLRNIATVTKGNRAMDGYFLRAESHYNVATEFGSSAPGVTDLHHMSHGESVMQVVQESFHGNGLYLLDEPESGLSMIRQMTLLAELHRAASAGAQLVIATHSPVLVALPGADIWEFTAEGKFRRGLDVAETTAYRALRDFLADPVGIAEFMVEVTGEG